MRSLAGLIIKRFCRPCEARNQNHFYASHQAAALNRTPHRRLAISTEPDSSKNQVPFFDEYHHSIGRLIAPQGERGLS